MTLNATAGTSGATKVPVLLVMALVATSATQLRLPGMPVGPGELGLLAWMVLAVASIFLAAGTQRRVPDGLWPIVAFWLLITPTLWLGFLRTSVEGLNEDAGAARDTLALAFVAVFATTLALRLARPADARAALRGYCVLVTWLLLAVLLVALPIRRIGPYEFWYEIVRFVGLATNPNQLALFMVPVPFVVFQLLADDPRLRWRRYAFLVLAAGMVGLATLSDALAIAWACSAVAGAAWWWVHTVSAPQRSPWRLLFAVVVMPCLLAASMLTYGPEVHALLERKVVGTIEQGAQASVRLTLWSHGVDGWAVSPLVGWGPGAHSGITAPFEGMEAHSTYIDWGTIAGVVGFAGLVALLSFTLARCLLANKPYLALAVGSLALFAAFHYVFRQPIFWFFIVALLAWTSDTGRYRRCAA